ncbi:leader peptidase (prepilin peptidase)/N-methyltransferase [Ruminiclostridium sufflavum DSM 19573]|uniref:Prepilin leader peptidase/N-methyltransferase n=1 Tax=Ruminiclostridium sufflavum DSM 19573 TaxID=1121337 RepID=A0A318XGI7_9FIRM|nr:A24 family peptidase [Ruminiclostridium sufflavum]PYG85645.1 leader peptidase (prepilin peptidase)/N-methyltransferase [Ruminiclostridium sufflavum DSM 19573]
MQTLITLYIAVFGLIIGSFLNVCIYRIPAKQSVISPPSHCTSCGTRLKALDLVPVFSYIFLRGKCCYCGEKVSARYPIVESLTSIAFVLLYFRFSISMEFFAAAVFSCILICEAFVDFDLKIIPDEFVLVGMLSGAALFAYNLFYPVSLYGDRAWYNPVIGIACGAGVLLLVAIIGSIIYKTEDAMGMGDVKLLAAVGLFLGWRLTLVALFLTVLSAAVISLVLIISRKINGKSTVAFGPFIAIGTFITMLYGWNIIELYLGFIPKQ